jgi:predicted NAD-dependent protein-ADP-ribosyltransferase YbiA (DUF1768 family)
MDIGSGNGYPSAALSNFAPHRFIFRGLVVESMEGLLQSLKFQNPEMQKHVMTLVGRAAKSKGAKKNWRRTQTLYWQGTPMARLSDEYKEFLDEAFRALFTQNEAARRALLATNDAVLTHSIGKSKESETVLTRAEFVRRLTDIRRELQKKGARVSAPSQRAT